MFRSNIGELKERAQGISHAEIFMDIFALSYVEPDASSDAPTVVAAKVANELLDVEGIKASFVVTEVDNVLYVSARSVDDVNVQVIMEKFNGGGHANVAGVQLKDTKKEEFFTQLKETLSKMYAEGEI
jgi:c-di-AMP phosphodiesterase-like protein